MSNFVILLTKNFHKHVFKTRNYRGIKETELKKKE